MRDDLELLEAWRTGDTRAGDELVSRHWASISRFFRSKVGEDTLIVVFVGATALCLKASLVALAVPPMLGISALFMLLQALTSIVQALIFALLATVYLYMMLPHEEHAHGNEEHAHASSH